MKKKCAFLAALFLACGTPAFSGFTAAGQSATQTVSGITGTVVDAKGEPLIGATVQVKNSKTGTATDLNGNFTIKAKKGDVLVVSYVGQEPKMVKVTKNTMKIVLEQNSKLLDDVVVTALGIKKDKKSLGYAIDDVDAEELMRNKSANPINSLAGKVAGVTITQTSGAAGAGSQIVLRGGTSLERDNQPLFVVDGVIYDNSTSSIGNSAFDGMTRAATTNSNRVMDINPEDIENMSILKGPAASALYGSRAASGVVIITTKKGKEGNVEVNFSAKSITSWVKDLPKTQTNYKRGRYNGIGKDGKPIIDNMTTSSWGAPYEAGDVAYDNIGDFFETGQAWDTNISVSGGNKTGNFFLSGSFFDQDGNIPTTGYTKSTFRFNGEQKWKMITFGASAAYTQARTNKTLTSAGLYGSGGSGTMNAIYGWSRSENMRHYLNEDGTPYRIFEGLQDRSADVENPYWMLDNYKMKDNTERFTGNFSIKVDITPWWWISYRMGIDSYTTENSNRIAENAAVKELWDHGMMSNNTMRYQYLSTNLMTNFNKQFGDFNVNLMLGTSTDDTKTKTTSHYGWNFIIPGFYSFGNIANTDKFFNETRSRHRLVGAFGEFRADWKSTVFLTVTGRNDWSSTLPEEEGSYFYPSVSGAVAFTELFNELPEWLTFGKVRASWAKVGKDASPYVTQTYLNNSGEFVGGTIGYGTSWSRGNPILKPEMTESTEIGLEMHFFNNRLKFDYAYYTNNSLDQIISPRGPQSTGFIFCSQNIGNVYNKGMELTISGTPIQTKDFTWESSINLYGNRGTVKNLPAGTETLYITDVQFGGAQAASFNDGPFLGISGNTFKYTDNGQLILDENFMPSYERSQARLLIGNREPKLQGGFNNTITWKGFTFNMLWEFRFGGDVYNGTDYFMVGNGMSDLTANRESLTVRGVQDDGAGNFVPAEKTFKANETYTISGAKMSGREVIQRYYTDYYFKEGRNYITNVNSLRLRTISLSYELPKSLLAKTKVIKRASVNATANNLLLFTNYRGDPESSAAGAGVSGSGAVGVDYCGVPPTASFAFGVNLTF